MRAEGCSDTLLPFDIPAENNDMKSMKRTISALALGASLVLVSAGPAAAAKQGPRDSAVKFDKRDIDGSGKLSLSEFQGKKGKKAEKKFQGAKAQSAKKKAKRFEKYDADGDGLLSQAEWAASSQRSGKKKGKK